jgi:hypothetical protein
MDNFKRLIGPSMTAIHDHFHDLIFIFYRLRCASLPFHQLWRPGKSFALFPFLLVSSCLTS